MEIIVQDIKDMFDNNYRALLGEDRVSDIAGILYNSPTARIIWGCTRLSRNFTPITQRF